MGLVKKVLEVDYHRNGVSGKGFFAIRFIADAMRPGHDNANFLACVADEPGECYVICTDLLETCGVRFARNSWRGDSYEYELRQAIAAYNTELDAQLAKQLGQ